MEIQLKTPKELDSLDLLQLVCELHTRAFINWGSKEFNDTYLEARQELEDRILKNCHIPPVPAICNCGKYHSKRNLIENKCPHCNKKIL
jgi:hypothetical protein